MAWVTGWRRISPSRCGGGEPAWTGDLEHDRAFVLAVLGLLLDGIGGEGMRSGPGRIQAHVVVGKGDDVPYPAGVADLT